MTEEMDDAELKDWRQAYRGLQEAGSAACPPAEALAALAVPEDARLAPEERLTLADHVASCRRCAALYRDLIDLHREAQAAAPGVLTAEAAGVIPPARPRYRSAWAPRALAAAAALAAVSLAGWNLRLLDQNRRLAADLSAAVSEAGRTRPAGDDKAGAETREALRRLAGLTREAAARAEQVARLEGEVAELRAPRFNVPVIDLDPAAAGAARGDAGEAGSGRTIALPAEAPLVTLLLNPSEPPAAGSYGLEILAADGRRVWSGTGLRPTPWDNFSLAVPRPLLPDGRYRLRLTTGRGRLLETYEVQIATLPAR